MGEVRLTHPTSHRAETSHGDHDHPAALDGALLALRLILAACFGLHGLIQVLGVGKPTEPHDFAVVLEHYGFIHDTTTLIWVVGLTESIGGFSVLLGLGTPLGAAGLFGMGVSIVLAKAEVGFFGSQGSGYEFELTLAVVSLVLLLAGPGRYAVDRFTPWGRHPLPYGAAGMVLAVLASMAIIAAF